MILWIVICPMLLLLLPRISPAADDMGDIGQPAPPQVIIAQEMTRVAPLPGPARPTQKPLVVQAPPDVPPPDLKGGLPADTAAQPAETRRPMAGAPLSLNVNEARFIRLDYPAKSVFLSNPGVADIDLQSARYLYIVGRSLGQTSLFVLDADDQEILSTTVGVRVDTARLTAAARRASGSNSVSVSALEGAIFLNGTVRDPADAEAARTVVSSLAGEGVTVISRIETGSQAQINLQVRIAEVSRSISEDLGIRLTTRGAGGRNSFNPAPSSLESPYALNVSTGKGSINLILDALARNGLVTILSEPNLTTRSGETANFLAGGRVPYVYGSGDEASLQMEAIGVELEFTPTVRNGNRIQIVLNTRVRDIDRMNSTNADAPALTERSATTTVELASGQSFAIAGMFQSSSQQGFSGLPALSRLPVIGALFRSSRYARGESELVIIVTPYVVSPGASRPRDPVSAVEIVPSGIEQALTGRFTRIRRPGEPHSATTTAGGFMLQ